MFNGNPYGEFSSDEQELILRAERLQGPRRTARGTRRETAPPEDGSAFAAVGVLLLGLVMTSFMWALVIGPGNTSNQWEEHTVETTRAASQPQDLTNRQASPDPLRGAAGPASAGNTYQPPPRPDPATYHAQVSEHSSGASLDYLPPGWEPAILGGDVMLYVREGATWRMAKSWPKGTEVLVRIVVFGGESDCWHALVGRRGEFNGYGCIDRLGPASTNVSWPLPAGWQRAIFHSGDEAVMYPMSPDWAFMIRADGQLWGYARPADFVPAPSRGAEP